MHKCKKYIAEASPYAITTILIITISINPDIFLPKPKNTFEHIIKTHFSGDPLAVAQHITNLLEQLQQQPLKKSTDQIPIPILPDFIDQPPARIETRIVITPNPNAPPTENQNLDAKINNLRKHGGRVGIHRKMIEE